MNKSLGAHFLLEIFFGNFNLKTILLVKSGSIIDEVAKVGKATKDAYKQGEWLILYSLLKKWVAVGVTILG